MNVMQKLSLWGAMHAAARDAAKAAEKHDDCSDVEARRREAQVLRERADRLHREIYRELGSHRPQSA